MDVESSVTNDIDVLLNTAIVEIEVAFKSGKSFLYGELAEKYGPLAHRVYKSLDGPSKKHGRSFFDKDNKPVLLDPFSCINRAKCLSDKDLTLYDAEFWNHGDMIKTLVDYLLLIQEKEAASACA